MKTFFIFFLRLFCCFVAAKLVLRALGLDSRDFLAGLTVLLTANLYWFDYLEYRGRISFRLGKMARAAGEKAAAGEDSAPEKPATWFAGIRKKVYSFFPPPPKV
jgi:hypothetical protein